MKVIRYPDKSEWDLFTQRPISKDDGVEKKVRKVIDAVRKKGDKALRKFTKKFDGVKVDELRVDESLIKMAGESVDDELKNAIQLAKQNITSFHTRQVEYPRVIETMPGVECWRKNVAIEKVGLYIPGGTAPLFSTILMLGVPAKIAGCRDVILCTPPDRSGNIHPAILYAANLVGINKIFRVGGAQAIAAMAFGTESIPSVNKIFGPGNAYVTKAKQLAQQSGVAIDMPAGPTEMAMLIDGSADVSFVVADVLSQAEHGIDSQILVVTTAESQIGPILGEIDVQLSNLPRKDIAKESLKNSSIVVMKDTDCALDLLNAYAPEHLLLQCDNAREIADKVVNAGSVFIGHYSPESVGDYASGTNHTLPTNGFARSYSGVSIDSFVKKITFQEISREGLERIGPAVEILANAEGLDAHKKAVTMRLRSKPK